MEFCCTVPGGQRQHRNQILLWERFSQQSMKRTLCAEMTGFQVIFSPGLIFFPLYPHVVLLLFCHSLIRIFLLVKGLENSGLCQGKIIFPAISQACVSSTHIVSSAVSQAMDTKGPVCIVP